MGFNISSLWKISTPQANETNDPPLYYKNIVADIEKRAAGAVQIVATLTGATNSRDSIPTAELYDGKRVLVLADNSEYVRVSGAWKPVALGWVPFTPTLANITLGTGGTAVGGYSRSGRIIHLRLTIVLGTAGFAVAANPAFNLPVNRDVTMDSGSLATPFGIAVYTDTSAGLNIDGRVGVVAAGTQARLTRIDPATGNMVPMSGTIPFIWAAGDRIEVEATYVAAD